MASSRLPRPSSSLSLVWSRCDRHQQWLARRFGLITSAKSSNRSGVTGWVAQAMGSLNHVVPSGPMPEGSAHPAERHRGGPDPGLGDTLARLGGVPDVAAPGVDGD